MKQKDSIFKAMVAPRDNGNLRLFYIGAVFLIAAGVIAQTVTAFAKGPQSVADIAEKLQGAVVNISTSQTLKSAQRVPLPNIPKGSPFEEFFKDFFDRQQGPNQPRKINSLGSGFVIDESGIIVTNNHVIKDADEIFVNFSDGTKLKVVKVIGRDSKTDLAIIKVEPKVPLTAVKFGNSRKMRVGDWVMAIGNPFGLGGTVTVGIISAKKRDINTGPYDEFIQTDAAINRGNSGGPLFNMEGEVVGVNTAIISPSGGSIGIGFSIPSNTAKYIIEQLTKYGEVRRGWLGVRIQSVSEDIADSLGMDKPRGAMVAYVSPESPAAKAGILAGDIILKFDGVDVPNMRVLPKMVARTAVDRTTQLEILRKGERKVLNVIIKRLAKEEKVTPAAIRKQVVSDKRELLGLSISPIDDMLREKYQISKSVKGVLILKVDEKSEAARKQIKPGDVIVEVTQEEVSSPQDVVNRVATIKKSGRKSVLLLIADKKGELRFVAIPIDKKG